MTLSTAQRVPILRDPGLAKAAFEPLREHEATIAACLMPDHVHWLLVDSSRMSVIVKAYKTWTVRRLRRLGVDGAVWQRSFYDRVIRRGEALREVAFYLVANPVRAGLVESVDDYPFQVVFPERFPEG